MKKPNTKKVLLTIWICLAILFFIWNWSTFQSRHLPKKTFSDTFDVQTIETKNQFTFQSNPLTNNPEIIFFQGGLTDPKAYAPLCRKLAENGFTSHLIKTDWRLPQYDYKKVAQLFDLKQKPYVIGGHSQGGKMAAQFVYENPNLLKGLFLLGTSHPRDIDLSNSNIPCLKLYAENDGLASVEEVMQNKNKLPHNTQLVMLKGGNHSQFGYLGTLFMDNGATISIEEQQQATLVQLLLFLQKVQSTNNQHP